MIFARPRAVAAPWRWLGVPTGRLAALWAAPLLLAVGFVVERALLAPMIAFDLVLFAIAGVDLWRSAARVEAARTVTPVQSVGEAFPVMLTLRHLGATEVVAMVTDEAPGRAEGLPLAVTLPARGAVELQYQLTVDDRGQAPFGDVVVRVTSPWGLWQRQVSLPVADALRIYPDFQQLRGGSLVARAAERQAPVRVRRRPGGESEFQRLRPYVPGDPYRHIDWKATARRRDFVTREYGQESNQNILFMLDCGRMMSARSGELTAFDHALNAAVMMGQVALRHGDRVGLLAFDGAVRSWLPPKGGARYGAQLIRSTYDLQPSLDEPDYAGAFRYLSHRVRRRSLVVLLTAVVDEVNADLAAKVSYALASRHLPLVVWIRDAEIDELLSRPAVSPDDRYVRGAAAELLGWRERSLSALKKRGALVVDARPDELSSDLLGRYLEIKARRLL
jgi:uncharacterized protein (DUF58 family)